MVTKEEVPIKWINVDEVMKKPGDYENLDDYFRAFVVEWGFIPLAAFGELKDWKANKDHYNGTAAFEDVVDFGKTFEKWRNYTVPVEQRWTAENKQNMPPQVKVLSHERPELKANLDRATDLVGKIYGAEPGQDVEPEREEYNQNIDAIMGAVKEQYKRKENSVAVTLLRGGERFEEDFPGKRVRVEAKRLDMEDSSMKFGMNGWEGLEAIQQENAEGKLDSVELVFADDCISTAGSIRSAIIALHERYKRGEFPKIDKVCVFAAAGVQSGIEDLVKHAQDLGIDIEVVVGDVVYQYSGKFYLERAAGEKRADGSTFKGKEPVVGDMGDLLKKKAKKIAAPEPAAD
jgi:hypothetical protein